MASSPPSPYSYVSSPFRAADGLLKPRRAHALQLCNMPRLLQGERQLTVGERYRTIRMRDGKDSNLKLEAKLVSELLEKPDQNKYWSLVKEARGHARCAG